MLMQRRWSGANHIRRPRSTFELGVTALLWMLAVAARGATAGAPLDQQLVSECDRVNSIEPPAEERSDAHASHRLVGCASEDLYYGIGIPRHYVQARQCAFLERNRGDELVFGGSAILMMIYANGRGVSRNLDVAIRFACAIESSPLELHGRIQHIKRLADLPQPTNFDLCDDVTSGFLLGHCAAHRARLIRVERAATLANLSAGWAPRDREALKSLEDAANGFFVSRSKNEVDLGGTSRSAAQIEEESSLWEAWVASLEHLEAGGLPRFSDKDFREADATLNAIYRRLQRGDGGPKGTVTFQGIREVQHRWLIYRDAWVAFGRVRYPRVAVSSWETWATQSRLRMLSELVN